MKVLVLSPGPYDTLPAMRFRLEQWARHLERDGLRFTFAPFGDDALQRVIYQTGQYARKTLLVTRALARRFALLPRLRNFDVIILHREAAILGPAILEWLMAGCKVPIVYDFDDPIWLPYRSPTNGVLSALKCPSKVAGICALATLVTAGNRPLAEWARQHTANVEIVPSTVDMDRYPVKSTGCNGRPTLGWTGSHSTLPFLDAVGPTLRRFAAQRACRLLVISHTDAYRLDSFAGEIQAKRWSAATEGQDLLDMDIGLAPFPDTGWTPWRCHGKVLQYMAAAIPTIASPIGVLPEYIQHGQNGFLAATDSAWLEVLARLSDDEKLRQQVGLAGRTTIAERYSAAVWAPRVRAILERAASVSPSRPARSLTGPTG